MSGPETQPQRTGLAWQRTGLGLLAVAGLLGHHGLRSGAVVPFVTAAVAGLCGLAVLLGLAPWRARALDRAPASAPVPVALACAAVVVAALAAAAGVLSR
ncbi:DUF202 domain-containing protein [Geodermatophilus sp. SYSU D00700]